MADAKNSASNEGAARRSPLHLLVVSRVVGARDDDCPRFQALDGRYIDEIATAFASTTVAAQVAIEGQHGAYANFAGYTFRFGSPGMALFELPMTEGASPGIVATTWKLVRQAWQIRRPVGRCDVALIFVPAYVGTFAAFWCRLNRRPYACYIGGDWGSYSPLAFRWRGWRRVAVRPYTWVNGWFERRVVGGASLLIVSGEEILRRYANKGRPVVRTQPLSSFAAVDFFPRSDTCETSNIRLLFVGALLPGKGLKHLIEALIMIPNAVLDVVGTGREEYAADLRASAGRCGVADRITWHGYVAEPATIRELYRSADVFVLPTLSEGAPRVVWEAMSQGLPVVISDIPPVRPVLADGLDAILAAPGDPSSIAAAIARVRADGELRRALIARGLETAAKRLSGDPSAQAIELLFRHVVPRVRVR